MKYIVTNISPSTYTSISLKLKPNETRTVDKETYNYLEKTFNKLNKFEFKIEGQPKAPKTPTKEKQKAVKEAKTDTKEKLEVTPKHTKTKKSKK